LTLTNTAKALNLMVERGSVQSDIIWVNPLGIRINIRRLILSRNSLSGIISNDSIEK